MELLVNTLVQVLRIVPLVLAFYIPALMMVVILRERGEAYQLKAILALAIGCGVIIAIHFMLLDPSALQVLETLLISLVQIAAALALAFFTVYRLSD